MPLHIQKLKVVRTPNGALEIKGKLYRPRLAMTAHSLNSVKPHGLFI
jgi:hypothetical protein